MPGGIGQGYAAVGYLEVFEVRDVQAFRGGRASCALYEAEKLAALRVAPEELLLTVFGQLSMFVHTPRL